MNDPSDPRVRRRILVVRHGAVRYFDEDGQPFHPRDVPLTDHGRGQVAALRQVLAPAAIDRVVCSGLPRTRQTADILVAGRGLVVEEDAAFREIRGGRLRDLPAGRVQALIAGAYGLAGAADGRFLGGDSFAGFADRVVAAFDGLVGARDWRVLLLVAHDAVNRVILCRVLGSTLQTMPALEQDPACLNIIDVDQSPETGTRFILRTMNMTAYEPAKLRIDLTSMEHAASGYRPREPRRGADDRPTDDGPTGAATPAG